MRQVPQCGNCQQYGHTKSYCRRCPICIKCAGDHSSKNCPQQNRSKDIKCVLFNGNHRANYKGCLVYHEIKKQKNPTPRIKQSIQPKLISESSIPPPSANKVTRETYAAPPKQE